MKSPSPSLRVRGRGLENPHFSRKERARNGAPADFSGDRFLTGFWQLRRGYQRYWRGVSGDRGEIRMESGMLDWRKGPSPRHAFDELEVTE